MKLKEFYQLRDGEFRTLKNGKFQQSYYSAQLRGFQADRLYRQERAPYAEEVVENN